MPVYTNNKKKFLLITEIINLLENSDFILIEKQHPMPKQGLSSTFLTGHNYGLLIGIIETLNINYDIISAAKWKKFLNITADKQSSINKCQELFPDISLLRSTRSKKPHDGLAEALLIAHYAEQQYANK